MTLTTLMLACVTTRGLPVEESWSDADASAVHLDLIRAFLEVGSCNEALGGISAARDQGLSGQAVDLLQAEALLCKGLARDALTLLDGKHRTSSERHSLVCLAHTDLGDVEDAATACQAAIRHLPRDASIAAKAKAWQNLGFVLSAEGEHSAAVDAYQQALLLDPNYGRARNNMAFALAAQGKDDEALDTFRVALDEQYGFDPEILEANAHFNLGLAQASRGDSDRARQSYRETLAIIPEHERARAALDDLTPNKEAN